MEDLSRLPCEQRSDQCSQDDEDYEGRSIDVVGNDGAASAGALFDVDELFDLGSQVVHVLLAGAHVRFDVGWIWRSLYLVFGDLLPVLLGCQYIFQPDGLLGSLFEEREERVELGVELVVGIMEGLKKERIFGQEIAAEASLFVHHELDETVGVGGDEIGLIDSASAALDILQA